MKLNKKLNTKLVKLLKNKTILITGGAGSIGSELTKQILEYPIHSVRVLDNNEHSLFNLGRKLNDSRLRLLLGSILDKDRVERAGEKIDIIFHVAAIKNIEISEFNPIETIETNINGTVNLVKMAMNKKPKIFVNISTDKAAESTTLYGTTKKVGEDIISWAGHHVEGVKFCSARFGNVIQTRGNVFEVWENEKKENKPLSITHTDMKRYFQNIDDACRFILNCVPIANQGEIFIPKMKMYKIQDLAKKISKNHKIIGLRKGEKLEEVLMTEEEEIRSVETKDMWIIK